MNIEKLFKKSNLEKRAITKIALSGEIDGQEIIRQALQCKKAGFGGVILHASTGLKTPYMSKEWLSTIKSVAITLHANGMETYIADEDRYPAGTCGSIASENPQFRAKSLTYDIIPQKDFSFDNLSSSVVGVYAIKLAKEDGLDKLEYYYKITNPLSIKIADDIMVVSVKENESSIYYNGGAYLDTLNSDAVQYYLSLTHERYKKAMGECFGNEINGFYSAEPLRGAMFSHMSFCQDWEKCCPYTYDTFKEFENRWQYNLLARLPELFFFKKGEEYSLVTSHYCEVISNQFINAYLLPYYEWCKENNLKLIANFAGEETLYSQTTLTGSVMNCYRYCDIPGVDIPYLSENNWGMVKQASSIKNQFNKQDCCAISGAGSGWGTTFNNIKNAGDINSLLGVTLRINDKALSTLHSVAKRDYPSAITNQSSFIEEYSYVEKYFARLDLLNKITKGGERVLVIHPLLSAWGMQVAGKNQNKNIKAYKKLEEKFEKTYSFFVRNSIGFDYGDELVMAETSFVVGKKENAKLVVGAREYKKVVVCGLESIRSSTVNILEDFVSKGGEVIFVGDAPSRVNGYKIDFEKTHLLQKSKRVEKLDDNFIELLDKPFAVIKENGKEKNIVIKERKTEDNKVVLFALNISKDKPTDATISIVGKYKIERANVRDGVAQNIKTAYFGGQTIIDYTFAQGEELVLIATKTEENIKAREQDVFEQVEIEKEFEYKLSEPNVVVFDCAQVIVNGKDKGEMDLLKADALLRKEYELLPRDTIQPYFKKHLLKLSTDTGYCDLEFKFTFEVKDKPNKLQLVLEEPERYIIHVNGRRLPITIVGDWVDSCLKKVALPTTYLVENENIISLSCRFSDELEIEPIYLVGDFGVKIAKKNEKEINQIIALPQKLSLGDITKQGLPYYGGKIYYFMNLEKGYYKVSFPGKKTFSYAILKSADKEKIVAFEPCYTEKKVGIAERDYTRNDNANSADVYEMKEIEGMQIEVGLTRRNTFGPFHYKFKKNEFATPYTFESDEENYSSKKILQKSGLLDIKVEKIVK